MSKERAAQTSSPAGAGSAGGTSRALELAGDSPELVAFALLRYLAQIEQASEGDRGDFDRTWLLDAYSECLRAVRGDRKPGMASGAKPRAVAR
jgi:hypothetical protein